MMRNKCLLNLITIYGLITALSVTNAQKCSFPGSPAHSSVTFSEDTLIHGTIASYSCERGFELLGPARRVCDKGNWTPEGIPFCVLNVAAGKAPMQISTDGPGIPQKAIDGSTSSFYSTDTCSLTKSERVPWWYVNLLEPYMVQLVRLDFGKSCCGNNKPATVVVRVGNNRPDLGTNPICNRFTGVLEEGQPLFLPCNPPMPGAFVSVHLEVSQSAALSICEAFVYTDQALPIERCPTFRDQPPGALASYNGKCYIFYNRQPMNLRDALQFCRSRGGTLINESNPALQGFISWELWRRHRSDVSSQYWMGAIRSNEDRNIWKWIGGDDVSVSFWNLPGGDEDCARYDGSKGWLWSDTNCNTQLNFICQHQPKACGKPEQPPNSTMIAINGYDVGASVEYKCEEGHLLIGPAQRTCLETGFYNEFPPVCKYIECGLPASIPHGTYELVNGSVGYLSQVVYKCNEGYQMLGRAMLTCDIDERWNGPPPRCEVVECDPIAPNHKNSKVFTPNGTFFGSRAEIQCARGYKLDGPSIITCTSSGQWSSPISNCVEDESSTTVRTSTQSVPATTFTRPKTSPPSRKTSTSVRTSSRFTTTSSTQKTVPISNIDLSLEDTDIDILPGTVREEFPSRKPVRPIVTVPKNNNAQQPTTTTSTTSTTTKKLETTTKNVQDEIDLARPEDNEVSGTNNNRHNHVPDVNIPSPVDNDESVSSSSSTYGAKLSLSSIIALSTFGGFVFLAALITTIVVLVRRNRSSSQHYRHRASPDCNTVASFDSSSSESRNGLNRYYRQAWENLHESASKNHNQLRRKETLDPQNLSRSRDNLDSRSRELDRSRENLSRGRDFGRDSLGLRDGSEMVVSDACVKGERKRHHHHHHHSKQNRNSNELNRNRHNY